MTNKLNSLAHTKQNGYVVIDVPYCIYSKYRRKIIHNQYGSDLRDYIKLLCKYKSVTIIEGHMRPDHVHLLVSISPKLLD